VATQIAGRYDQAMTKTRPALRGFDVDFLDVAHAGEVHRVQIKRVATARRFTLRVRAATRDALLTVPPRSSLSRAKAFVERHAAWIGARLDRLPQPTPFAPGALIPLRGILHEVQHRPDQRGTVWIEEEEGAPPRLCVSGALPFVARRVQDYLIREARDDLRRAVARHTAALGVKAQRVTLRDTVTRWGSCSSSGALSFSWRLVMAPPFVLDYLAAHEVAHLCHLNHSDAFWTLTERLIPDYRRAESWLKAQGVGLMRFGATERVSIAPP
jgi:predicted metal-dependent hydrolase